MFGTKKIAGTGSMWLMTVTRACAPQLAPLWLRNLERLESSMVVVMVLFAVRHRYLLVLPPRWGQGARRMMPLPPVLLLPRRWLRTVVLAVLFMDLALTL